MVRILRQATKGAAPNGAKPNGNPCLFFFEFFSKLYFEEISKDPPTHFVIS